MSLVDEIFGKIFSWFQGDGIEFWKSRDLALQAVQIASALTFPLVLCDKKLSILLVNPAFTRLFKIDADQLKGKTLLQVLGSNVKIGEKGGRERQLSSLLEVVGWRNPKILTGIFPKLGQRVFHFYTRTLPPNLLFVFQDVTEEKELQAKIENSRSELLSVFDGIDDPMVMINRNFRICRINESMLKVLGGSSYKSFIGKACYLKLHGQKERCPGCTADKTFTTGKKTTRLSLLAARPNAEDFSYQITHYPLKGPEGKVTGIAECYKDITDVKQIEEELFESERTRVMEPLAAGIAHEVRNPLAIIRSTAQYCLGEIGKNADLEESLSSIIRSAESANRVISDFLDFARPQSVDFKWQSLRPLLEEGLRLIKGRAKGQKVRVIKSIGGNIPNLMLDKRRFLQAIMNFLINSLDAMPEGGRLEIEARRQNHRGNHRACEVVIRDSGKGVPEEMVSELFKPFYSTKKEGVGLGLPIAEGIIRAHGGRVQFRSWEGKGSEVHIFLFIRKKED